VAALALWLLYRARSQIACAPVRSVRGALVLLVPASLAAVIFWRASIEGLQFLMFPALILLAALTAFGVAVTRAIAVPVAFLYFAMPAWNALARPLQSLTLAVVRWVAPAIGLPATISGSWISLPDDMTFDVTLMCSGVGFLVQGLAVAALLGELEQAPWKRRLRLLGAMVLIAIITNWIRVLAIVQLGYSTQMRHVLVTRHHLLFGYMLFVLVLVAFVWLARQRSLPDAPPAASAVCATRSPAPRGYFTALAALAAAPTLIGVLSVAAEDHRAPRELRLPSGRADWRGPLTSVDATWRPLFVGPHGEWRGTYRDLSGRTVEVLAVGYDTQAQDQELVNESNSLVGSGGLTTLTARKVDAGGQTYREEIVADGEGRGSVIWSLYSIGGRPFVTPLLAQLWYGMRALGKPPYSALFAFRAACSPSCSEARGALREFVRVMGPELLAAPQIERLHGTT
jgi:EpsI family protein